MDCVNGLMFFLLLGGSASQDKVACLETEVASLKPALSDARRELAEIRKDAKVELLYGCVWGVMTGRKR